MRQIAENSTQAARQTPFLNLLGYWWATWLASGIISTISSWLEKQSDKAIQAAIEQAGEVRLPAIPPEAIQQQINTIYLDTATYALSFICFCFLLRIIQRTNQAQNALATQQGSLKP